MCSQNHKVTTTISRKNKSEQCIWQRRFWEHQIQNQKDFNNHVNYIHYNPVKHGYVKSPCEWKYSCFHRYVRNGIYEKTWGDKEIMFSDAIGAE